jgi:hypothetical protein
MSRSPVLVAAVVSAVLAACGLLFYMLRRPTPAERERRRRLEVHRRGRIIDGTIVDAGEPAGAQGTSAHLVHYTYSIGGVDYEAWQDIAALLTQVGGGSTRLIGPVYVKYHSKNPANSIILCEEWSGLRAPRRG